MLLDERQSVSSVFIRSPQSWYYLNLWRSPIIVSLFNLSAIKFEKNIYDFQITERSSFRQLKWKQEEVWVWIFWLQRIFLGSEKHLSKVCRVEGEKADAIPVYWYTGEDKALAELECWCALMIYSPYWISGQRKWGQTATLCTCWLLSSLQSS